MTTQETIRRALRLVLVLSVLTTGGAFLYERDFVKNGIETRGRIISFKQKNVSSTQGDSIEMEIQFPLDGQQVTFYSSRNVIEQLMGSYKPGDMVPVVYNAAGYPSARIAYPQHLFKITLIFMVFWILTLTGLTISWYKNVYK